MKTSFLVIFVIFVYTVNCDYFEVSLENELQRISQDAYNTFGRVYDSYVNQAKLNPALGAYYREGLIDLLTDDVIECLVSRGWAPPFSVNGNNCEEGINQVMTLRIDVENQTRNYEHFKAGECSIDPNQTSIKAIGHLSSIVTVCESSEVYCPYNMTTGQTADTFQSFDFTSTIQLVTYNAQTGPWKIKAINLTLDDFIVPPEDYPNPTRSVRPRSEYTFLIPRW